MVENKYVFPKHFNCVFIRLVTSTNSNKFFKNILILVLNFEETVSG